METPAQKRERTMEEKYGGKEALRELRRQWQAKAGKDTPRGFAVTKERDPEAHRKLSAEAGRKGGKVGGKRNKV